MNVMLWMLAGGITGWLTGKIIGRKGYGDALYPGYVKLLDIFLGIIGASIGGYLFFWSVIGEATPTSDIATAVLGAIALVGLLRQFSITRPGGKHFRFEEV
jgi:uncharacterized membrane protein YeaQ/YmgE (transglycosylase-associated protein family)